MDCQEPTGDDGALLQLQMISDTVLRGIDEIRPTIDPTDSGWKSTERSPISKLFGVEQEQASRCTKCSSENSKTCTVLLSSLMIQDMEGLSPI